MTKMTQHKYEGEEFRRTKGIISDVEKSNPAKEADVIMTAVALGFVASFAKEDKPVQFDIDPGDKDKDWESFQTVVEKIARAVGDFLNKEPETVAAAGFAPKFGKGAVITGVYRLANQEAPKEVTEPNLSDHGQRLYDKIKQQQDGKYQYIGRGAYTGFVDNKNKDEINEPIGPLPTARFLTPKEHNRWLPPLNGGLWESRRRKDSSSYVPWGLIGGDMADADKITREMKEMYGMKYVGGGGRGDPPDPTKDIAAYTHGMIQAIYAAYALGPSCTPYEIAVGEKTTKMASCLCCTLFMVAAGYPPNSIHLGRGESWAPLYAPYIEWQVVTKKSKKQFEKVQIPHLSGVVNDLNHAWRVRCHEWMELGLQVLDENHVTEDHKDARMNLEKYRQKHNDITVASTLILDAITIHDSEWKRIDRTLKLFELSSIRRRLPSGQRNTVVQWILNIFCSRGN